MCSTCGVLSHFTLFFCKNRFVVIYPLLTNIMNGHWFRPLPVRKCEVETCNAGGSNHFKACWASKCHQASTHGLFFDSETYLWSLNEVMTYNISWSWLSQYCWRMRKATRPWSQSLASLDRSFQRRTFTYFQFFFQLYIFST